MATEQEVEKSQKALEQWYLGKTSKHYESGTSGPAAISTGVGDHGGVSYGSYQLSSNMGTLKEYLDATNNYNGAFDGLKPKTAAFDQKWVELAKNDPNFHRSQHDFIASQHYEPQKKALERAGYDFSERGKAVQDMLWSTAVQYRGYTVGKIERAERESGLDFSKASDKEIITAVQDSKYKHYKEDFASSSKQWKGISNRMLDEKAQLLKLAGYEEIINTQQQNSKTPDMHYNGSQLEPVKQSSLEVPDNFKSLEASAEKQVRDLYAQAGIDFADGGQNTVGKVVYEAAKANLTEVEQMTVKDGQIHIAQKDPSGFGYTTASFGAVEAANTEYSKSIDGLAALSNPQQVASLTPDQNKTIDEPTKARSIA